MPIQKPRHTVLGANDTPQAVRRRLGSSIRDTSFCSSIAAKITPANASIRCERVAALRLELITSPETDHKALVTWLDDFSGWKSYAGDGNLERFGIKEGGLLITDPTEHLELGHLVVVADMDSCGCSVAIIQRDDEGQLWAAFRDIAVPIDSDHELLMTQFVGFAPLNGEDRPATADNLLLARRVPLPKACSSLRLDFGH